MRRALLAAIMTAAGTMVALAQAPGAITPPPKEPGSPAAVAPPGKGKAAKRDTAVRPGGQANNKEYNDCLALWDAKTHMTRQEWSATCRRVQSRINTIN
jgi:hypothetical protein